MKFHILTLFPEMMEQGLKTSIIGRGIEHGYLTVNPVDIRNFTTNKHKKVDDYPYGGGAGMLIQAQSVFDAHKELTREKQIRTIYLTPQGKTFSQQMAEEYAKEEELIFLCGHYEGIDERVLEEVVTDYVSIGDYILTGGELPTMVMIDAISRLVPGVLSNEVSAETESFQNHLLEYPQYSRPEVWHGKKVPEVLLTGNHKKIDEWRREQSILRTKERRPDLYQKYDKQIRTMDWLMRDKLLHMDMIQLIYRGQAEILESSERGVLLLDKRGGAYMISVTDKETGIEMLDLVPKQENYLMVSHQEFLNETILESYKLESIRECYQAVYTRKEKAPLNKTLLQQGFHMKVLGREHFQTITEHYHGISDVEYIEERMRNKTIYGGFLEQEFVGFIGMHIEGSIGMLVVFEPYRNRGIAAAMETEMINGMLRIGYTPYGQVFKDNEISLALQRKLNLAISKNKLYWIS